MSNEYYLPHYCTHLCYTNPSLQFVDLSKNEILPLWTITRHFIVCVCRLKTKVVAGARSYTYKSYVIPPCAHWQAYSRTRVAGIDGCLRLHVSCGIHTMWYNVDCWYCIAKLARRRRQNDAFTRMHYMNIMRLRACLVFALWRACSKYSGDEENACTLRHTHKFQQANARENTHRMSRAPNARRSSGRKWVPNSVHKLPISANTTQTDNLACTRKSPPTTPTCWTCCAVAWWRKKAQSLNKTPALDVLGTFLRANARAIHIFFTSIHIHLYTMCTHKTFMI